MKYRLFTDPVIPRTWNKEFRDEQIAFDEAAMISVREKVSVDVCAVIGRVIMEHKIERYDVGVK